MEKDVYRAKDGSAYFEFRFVWVSKLFGGHYEIDIVSMPGYGGRSSGLHATHRLPSSRGGHKICFGNNSQVNTLSKAKKWAGVWAEHTWKYILYGISFPNS